MSFLHLLNDDILCEINKFLTTSESINMLKCTTTSNFVLEILKKCNCDDCGESNFSGLKACDFCDKELCTDCTVVCGRGCIDKANISWNYANYGFDGCWKCHGLLRMHI